ncbi:MAG: hypothetical protein QNJ60_09595 [Xenococcaceae cyanobacterium MO_188.B19]|nr:hypothetical protein [Xenococcaceae cyanobacterium MO_188.B19]
MKYKKKTVSLLQSLLRNNIIQFLIGLFVIVLLTQVADAINLISLKISVKSLGYGIFFYLATPFSIYWLAYVSAVKLTKFKLIMTMVIISMYSYVFWDAYFSYKAMLKELLFSPH